MRNPDPSIAIRVDATSQTGTGHFMRCLALADALRHRKGHVRFIGRRIPDRMRKLAAGNGHQIVSLPQAPRSDAVDELPHAHWLGTSQSTDAEHTIQALAGNPVDWLIVDHYALDARWESALRKCATNILAIDDLADRVHDCDALLDQNLHNDMQARYSSRVPAGCRLLLGPEYALLREEFRQARALVRARNGKVKRVLILMGGIDVGNLTGRALEAVSRLTVPLDVDVIVGAEHPARDVITKMCRDLGYALHVQPPGVAALMAAADLAVGAGGSTNWERCCLGLPGVVISVADNQDGIAESLHRAGAIFYIGRSSSVTADTILLQLQDLLADPKKVALAAANGMALVDGNGATRVAGVLWGGR